MRAAPLTGTLKPRYLLPAFVLGLLLGCSRAPVTPPNALSTEPAKNDRIVVSLTFDDGDADNYAVRPVLAQYGLRATFFIPSGLIGTEGYMTKQQLRGLYEDGNEIGGHTLSHQKLTGIHGEELRRQICQDRSNLQALGFDVISFAYPFGGYEADTKQVVQECGYRSARIILGGPDSIPAGDPYALRLDMAAALARGVAEGRLEGTMHGVRIPPRFRFVADDVIAFFETVRARP